MQHEVEYTIEAGDDEISFARREQRRTEPEMDITPMIDITFLLLIFFLVASRLSDEAFVELPSARHGTAVSSESSLIVTLTKGSGDEAVIYKGDGINDATRLSSTDLQDQQAELQAYIEKGLTVDSKSQLLIKAEEGVRHRDVARVARAAGEATASVMYLAVAEER